MEGLFVTIPVLMMIAIPVLILLLVSSVKHSIRKAKVRRAAMAAWAAERGLYFHSDRVRGFDREYLSFGCLRQGSNRYAFNIIGGTLDGFEMKMFDRMKAAFGSDDINFESAEFSRKFYVSCEDKRWAYDVIHGKVMELLMGAGTYTIEGDGQTVLIRLGESRLDLAGFERAFGVLATILREIPEHAKERAGHEAR